MHQTRSGSRPLIALAAVVAIIVAAGGSATTSRAPSSDPSATAAPATSVAMVLPVIVFYLAQRAFMRGVVITGVEK